MDENDKVDEDNNETLQRFTCVEFPGQVHSVNKAMRTLSSIPMVGYLRF